MGRANGLAALQSGAVGYIHRSDALIDPAKGVPYGWTTVNSELARMRVRPVPYPQIPDSLDSASPTIRPMHFRAIPRHA